MALGKTTNSNFSLLTKYILIVLRMVLAFVGWLISKRKVSAGTISQYLSGLRVIHLKKGVWPGSLRPEIVKSILKGHEQEVLKCRIPRLAMTMPIMNLLKKLLTKSKMELSKKRLVWAICCLALHGSFRIHELLAREELQFDPTSALLGKDVRKLKVKIEGSNEDLLVCHLKNPKEDKLKAGVNIELISTGTLTCPVAAWEKWQSASKLRIEPLKPVFRLDNGKCMTGASFNKILKDLLCKYINYEEKKFLSHSFRAGFASMMAEAGYKDEEIMRQGRWHSQAFMAYCKTGRGSRLKEQRDLARKLTEL